MQEHAPGWHDAGPTGGKEECLAYIERARADLRPPSLRRQMDEAARAGVVLELLSSTGRPARAQSGLEAS